MIWERSQAPPENKDSYIHWSVGARRAGRARPSLANPRARAEVGRVVAVTGTGWYWPEMTGAVSCVESVARVRASFYDGSPRCSV